MVYLYVSNRSHNKYEIYDSQSTEHNIGCPELLPNTYIFKCDINDIKGKQYMSYSDSLEKRKYSFDFDTHLTQQQLEDIKNSETLLIYEIDENDITNNEA